MMCSTRWAWLGMLLVACGDPETRDLRQAVRLEPREALSGDSAAGFARALEPRSFVFPEDHGPHPEFRTEWWYVTGNLYGSDRRRFGYQLTIFRNALGAEAPKRRSAWATRDVWFAHFAVTDVEGGAMHGFERFSRPALGLAGATAAPFRVWLEDWEIAAVDTDEGFRKLRVRARQGDVALDLDLRVDREPVLQGEQGLSRKSAEPGNASYYYSYPRIPSRGTVTIGETEVEVTGETWLDREWSTSALASDQVGWDWFALQLEDGRELMYYQMRKDDGTADAASAGIVASADGSVEHLGADEFELDVLETWGSPRHAEYPSAWSLRVPTLEIELAVRPVLADQEHDFLVRYWEGAVDVTGPDGVRGHGYVELTGYEPDDAPR